jgi:CHAT domain
MREPISILFLSANPWTTSRILVDEEAREIFNKLQEGPNRERFVLQKHVAIKPSDVQRLLMTYRPHIVHFSGHGSKKHKIILGGVPGRGQQIEREALVEVLALYRKHLRLVFLNACFTRTQARSLSEVIDYSIGAREPIGDKEGVAFAGAFYRALGFGKSVTEAFDSAMAEMALMKMKRARGLELFVHDGVSESDRFPHSDFDLDVQTADAGARAPGNSQTLPERNAIDLWRSSMLGRAGAAIGSEQITWSYSLQWLVGDGSDTFDSAPNVSTVYPRLTRSPRLLIHRAAGSASVVRGSTTVSLGRSVATLKDSPANRQRTRANSSIRGCVASKGRLRKGRKKRT